MIALILALALQDDLVEELGASDPDRRQQAELKLLALGTDAVPALRKGLTSTDPEIAARAEKLLAVLAWDLPADRRASLGFRLADTGSLSPGERARWLVETLPDELDGEPDLRAHVLAQALDREKDADARKKIAEAIAEISGGPARIIEWSLRASAERDPIAQIREIRERDFQGIEVAWTREAFDPVHRWLRARGLADLATPGLIEEALEGDGAAARYRKIARILDKAGLPLEAALAWRRALFLGADDPAALRELDRISRSIPCVRDHLALLSWIRLYATDDAVKKEAASLAADDRIPEGDVALADALRLSGWLRIRPARRNSGLDTRIVEFDGRYHVAFETWVKTETVTVDTYDVDTGTRLWTYAPAAQPHTDFELSDIESTFRPTKAGLLFSYQVETCLRTGVTLLDRSGKSLWTREYDLWGQRLSPLDEDRFALVSPNGWYQTWICRLSDGQILETHPDNLTFPISGAVQVNDSIPPTVTMGKRWKKTYDINKGVGDSVVVSGRDTIFLSVGWKVLGLSPKDGSVLWERELPADETVHRLAADGDGVLLAIREGYTKWRIDRLTSGGEAAWSARSSYGNESREPPPFHALGNSVTLYARELFDGAGKAMVSLKNPAGLDLLSEEHRIEDVLVVSGDPVSSLSLWYDGTWLARIRPAIRSAPGKILEAAKSADEDTAETLRRFARDLDPYGGK